MNQNKFVLSLNKNEKIIIESAVSLEKVNYYSDASFTFVSKSKKIVLFNDSLKYGIEILHTLLYKALHGELLLHSSINQDIGCLYNEEIQNKKGLFYEQLEGRKFWVGRNYHLWGYDHLTTWLYNNVNADLVLEVTPIYPDNFSTPKKTAYNNWLASYQPCLLKILSKKIAQQWLAQIQNILNQIDCNTNLEIKNLKNKL